MYNQQNFGYENGAYGAVQQQQPPPIKTVIGTEEVQEMIQKLNTKPFSQSFSLVTFDELNTTGLLDILNKVLAHLDSAQFSQIQEQPHDQIIYEVTNFVKILNYPVPAPPQEVNWQNGIFGGDRRVIYPLLYYLLTRLTEHEKRAYLARYLVPFELPEDIPLDEEFKKYMEQYRDQQAVFQVTHQQFEGAEKQSTNPQELKKEIAQLEQEREQLNAKIKVFQGKNTNKPEFQALLEQTNHLRKEQEQEAKLAEKLRQQRSQFDWTDQQLLSAQQRLIDAQKSVSADNTPEQMLMAQRNEVKRNRELCYDRLAIEINEKRKKLEQTEKLLSDPPVTANELMQMENHVVSLRRAINGMEEKLSKQSNPQDDKLAIYKQQAALTTQKKERTLEDLKRAEEEMTNLQKEIEQKEQRIEKQRGPGFKSKDDFNKYAEDLKSKTSQFKKMKEEIKEIQNEVSVLTRTEQIVQMKKEQHDGYLKQLEAKHGMIGYSAAKAKMDEVSDKKSAFDEQKAKTLDEISKIVTEIKDKIASQKNLLQPQIEALKTLRQKFETIEAEYKGQQAQYDRVMVGSESETSTLEAQVKKLKEEAYKEDTQISILKYQAQIYDLQIQRLNDEHEFQKGSKTLNSEFQSYVDLFTKKAASLEGEIKELRKQREIVKEQHEPSLRQQNMFSDLQKLLQLKMKCIQNEGRRMDGNARGQNEYGNVNRLVINK